jgi:F-type H+-transporting ATPase subunit delta
MSEYITIARPYAKAVFDSAKNEEKLEEWDSFLSYLSSIVSNSSIISIIKNRTINYNDKSRMIISFFDNFDSTLDKEVIDQFSNFIKVLAYYGRLLCINDIYFLYKQYMNQLLNCVDAIIKVPCVINSYQKDDIINSLAKRFDKKVIALFEVDENLLGGFCVKVGDSVLDASILGNLQSLSSKIML